MGFGVFANLSRSFWFSELTTFIAWCIFVLGACERGIVFLFQSFITYSSTQPASLSTLNYSLDSSAGYLLLSVQKAAKQCQDVMIPGLLCWKLLEKKSWWEWARRDTTNSFVWFALNSNFTNKYNFNNLDWLCQCHRAV